MNVCLEGEIIESFAYTGRQQLAMGYGQICTGKHFHFQYVK